MMDAVEGMGHRIKWGHDLDGMIEAADLAGIPGIFEWMKHMLVDFMSPQGLPLPFADAVRIATGMEMDEAIDWLCVNVTDVIEVGGMAAILEVFKRDRNKLKVALAVGVALGIVEDNPLLLALNTVIFLKTFGRQWPFLRSVTSSSFLNRALEVSSRAAMGLGVVEIGLGLMGLDLGELLTGIGDAADLSDAMDFAEALADIIDGVATVGIAMLARRGIGWALDSLTNWLTKTKRERVWKKQAAYTALRSLREGLRRNAPIPNLAVLVRAAKQTEYYWARLQELRY